MLSFIKFKFNNCNSNIIKHTNNKSHYMFNNINYPPSIKEWYDSTYSYNKNTVKLLPIFNKYVLKLIRGYFNLYSVKLEKNIKLYKLPNWMRRLSIKRILISGIELKHTNDKVIINLYLYSRCKFYIYSKVHKLIERELFINKIKLIREKIHNIFHKLLIKNNYFLQICKWSNNNIKVYENLYFIYFINKFLSRIKLYMYYKQILLLNEFKLKDTYIIPLKILLEKIYNKNIEFNIVSLKYYYLNTDIYLQILALKLRNRNNRIYKVLNKSFLKIKLPNLHKLIMYANIPIRKIHNLSINNLIICKNKESDYINDSLNNALFNYYKWNLKNYKENIILNSIKHRIFGGIRIEAAGRLSKRLVAARTVFKYKYTGNLRNLNSSYLGIPSTMLRGNLRSNLSYTKLKSKTKIGSYGLKSWINNV